MIYALLSCILLHYSSMWYILPSCPTFVCWMNLAHCTWSWSTSCHSLQFSPEEGASQQVTINCTGCKNVLRKIFLCSIVVPYFSPPRPTNSSPQFTWGEVLPMGHSRCELTKRPWVQFAHKFTIANETRRLHWACPRRFILGRGA